MSLSVIIPSRNDANLLACAAAVRSHEPDAWILVVDDGLASAASMPSDPCMRICGERPFIFSRNVNSGITCVWREEDDVVVLNDDALLQTPGGFSLLQRAAEEHPEFGLIAATCNNVGNQNQFPQGCGLREEPRMVCFVAVLIPRRTIDAVGLLDERYEGYGCEDDDYCVRVRKAGLKIGIHDGCYVDHGSLTSTFRGAAGAGGDFRANAELFRQKWGADNMSV